MGNLVDSSTPGVGGMTMRAADKLLGVADPLLRRTRACRLIPVQVMSAGVAG